MSRQKLWFGWVVVSILSWAIGFTVLTLLDSLIRWSTGLTMLHIAVSALMGAIIGIGQWIILRRQIEKAKFWVFASAVGFGIGLPLSTRVAVGHDVVTGQLLANLVFGSVFGLAQWITVQRRVRETVFWMLASVVGWSAGIGGTTILAFSERIIELRVRAGFMPVASAIANGLAPGIVVGALYGVITGAVLIWMLNDARRSR